MRAALAVFLVLVLAGVGVWHRGERESSRRSAELETSLLRKQFVERSETRRLASGAGISMQPIRVHEIDRARLARLADVAGHDRYARRCASCHGAPEPAVRSPNDWYRVVERMQHHMERAGVIPPDSTEQALILEFLRAAATR